MKTNYFIGILLSIFLLTSCVSDDLFETTDLNISQKSSIAVENLAESQTYYFDYGMEKVGNEWTDNTFLKLQFEDLSSNLDTLKINGLVIPNIHSNLITVQVENKSNDSVYVYNDDGDIIKVKSHYKYDFKQILLVGSTSSLTENQIKTIEYQNKIKVIVGKTASMIWNHEGHELISVVASNNLKVGWKLTESVNIQTVNGYQLVAINFPLNYKESNVNDTNELIIKENNIFKN